MSEDTAAQQPQEPDAPSQQSAETESSKPDSPETASQPKTDRTQRRIDQLVARMSKAEERATKAETELEALRNQEPDPEPPARPKRSDFEDADAFADALADWTDERIAFADQQRETAEQKRRQEAEDRKSQASVTEKQQQTLAWLEQGNDDIEDFFEVVTQAPICSQAMLDVAESMEGGHKVLYELVQDEAEAARIAQLDGNRVAIEMTQRLQPKAGKSSQAPEPANPATGAGDKPDQGDLRDDLPMDEWAKRFRSRRAKRRQSM